VLKNRVHIESGRRHLLRPSFRMLSGELQAQAGFELAAQEKLASNNLSPEIARGNQRFAADQLTSVEHDLTNRATEQ
jgi:hypothetical protein